MGKETGKCVVCGTGPTVKAHLFPRALMLDMKADALHLIGGDRHKDGVKLQQNGEWDDRLLCDHHENVIGAGDDYGISFFRSFRREGRPRPGNRAMDVPNPTPDLLMHFAYAVIWRHVASTEGRAEPSNLGPYAREMLDALKNGGPYALELLVGRNPLTVRGKRVDIAVAPYRDRMDPWNVWHFAISGLDFYLKLDGRAFPVSYRPYLANVNDPIVIGQIDERGVHEVPKLHPILNRMRRTNWKP